MHTVLIVEDDFLISMGHVLCVQEMGWKVLGPASNVEQALAYLHLEAPSVGLLDFNLGQESVTPVAQALKMRCIPFIMASAVANLTLTGGPVFEGVVNVGKPVTDSNLSRALQAMLGI